MAAGKLSPDENGIVPFDYTEGTWRDWLERSFQYHTVPRGVIDDGLQAAIGSFTLRSLAKGYMKPEGAGRYTIIVTGVSVFVEDRFTFQKSGDDFYWWTCERKKFIRPYLGEFTNAPDVVHIFGSNFLSFQDRHNCGNDFLTLTTPHAVEGFQEMRYDMP